MNRKNGLNKTSITKTTEKIGYMKRRVKRERDKPERHPECVEKDPIKGKRTKRTNLRGGPGQEIP